MNESSNSGIKQLSLLTNVVFITGFVLLWIMLSVMSGMVDRRNQQYTQQVPDKQVVLPLAQTQEAAQETSPTVAGTSIQKDVDASLQQMDSVGVDAIENDYK